MKPSELKTARRRLGLTQQGLAQALAKLGITRSSRVIQNWEQGRSQNPIPDWVPAMLKNLEMLAISILDATPAMADIISGRAHRPAPDLPIKQTCAYQRLVEFLNLAPYRVTIHPGHDSSPWPQRLREVLDDSEARVIKIFSRPAKKIIAAIDWDGYRAAYVAFD